MARGGGGSANLRAGYRKASTGWYWMPECRGDSASVAYGTTTLSAFPDFNDRSEAIDRVLNDCVTLAATAVLRVGVYLPDPTTGLPGVLLADWGTQDGSGTGVKSLTVATTLPAGRIWYAWVAQTAAATWRATNLLGSQARIGVGTTPDVPRAVQHNAAVAGALPNPFVPDATVAGSANAVRFQFRAA